METIEQLVSFHHIQVQLSGGAPWGFTLKGGLEHGEPLIITKLIKGSYRILKLTVRRRSVPLIRPHSWHLAKLSELPLPPPPSPPPPPCLPPADSPPLPPPPPLSAMQLHPGSYTLPWHTADNSDLSLQWGHLTRPYSSTDRSSSVGSMESLDAPTPTTQLYSDSRASPVDPALFNNKRDSAYSSFSTSSNTSDYATVPLRPGEACSMDNLLQSLGPTCGGRPGGDASTLGGSPGEALDDARLITQKSRSLTRPRSKPIEVKERPSSCCYEEERRGGDFESLTNGGVAAERKMNPPQPPTRKDSFRVTRNHPEVANKRCASAPIQISRVSCCCGENQPAATVGSGIHNGFPAPEDAGRTGIVKCDPRVKSSEPASDCLAGPVTASVAPVTSSIPGSLPAQFPTEVPEHPPTKLRHGAPEKLLATQLQPLQLHNGSSSSASHGQSDPPDGASSTRSGRWSTSPIQLARGDRETSPDRLHGDSNKDESSRCSTPGSAYLEGSGDDGGLRDRQEVRRHPWGRSVSVPDDPAGSLNANRIHERHFEPLGAAASVDSLLEEQRGASRDRSGGNDAGSENDAKKSNARNHRRNRRRSDRFATNLRNEIQRKMAQLQRSRGPGGLLYSGETVQEEDGPDPNEDGPERNYPAQEGGAKVPFAPTVNLQDTDTAPPREKSNSHDASQTLPQSKTHNAPGSVHILDPGVPSFGVGIRVVEEPAPAGKARRWRWTPEHKLQPEPPPDRGCRVLGERVSGVGGSQHGVCTFTSSSAASDARAEESDILPFADRKKFFEETSKGASSSCRLKKPPHPELGQHSAQRRYSYQDGDAGRERLEEKEREQAREEKEREARLREGERQRDEGRREAERARMRGLQTERAREWERERERGTLREEDARLTAHQNLYSGRDGNQDVPREDNVRGSRPRLQVSPHGHARNQVSPSAFHPVGTPSRPGESHRHGYAARSCTATEETCATRRQEVNELNRKCSPTESDRQRWRRESKPPETDNPYRQRSHGSQRGAGHLGGDHDGYVSAPPPASLSLRGRAMSENDLRFESCHRWSPSVSVASSQTLVEVEEGGSGAAARLNRKKTPPPPRPPPPKWEQFHRRRASHHALFSSSSSSSSAAPQSVPPSLEDTGGGHPSDHAASHGPPVETSRQRSYSLPPERHEASAGCPRCSCQARARGPPSSNQHRAQTQAQPSSRAPSNQNQTWLQEAPFTVAPPSPMFSRRAFRPVAPPQRDGDLYGGPRERDAPSSLPQPTDGSVSRYHLPEMNFKHAGPGAEWGRAPPPRVHSNSPVTENGGVGTAFPPDSYLAIGHQQQRLRLSRGFQSIDRQKISESETTLSPSPAHSLDADLDIPMETDIDDFREDERLPAADEPITSEVPCFALPVTVLETDMDTLTGSEDSPSSSSSGGGSRRRRRRRMEADSLEEELETKGRSRGERLSLEELFPQSSEGEEGMESWRGPYQTTEHSTDSLDRRSGASSSCSSYYSTSAAKAQLLSQMKDFTDGRRRDDDDELTYKKQLMESLRKKLGVLREAQRGLQEDIRANAQLGEEVESMVVGVCKPNEVDKFRMFIGDLDKVVSLLLSLSGRLLRVETTLDTLDPEAEHHERLPLVEKKCQLMRQLSEAQDLKDHVDRREQAVSRVLARCLSPEQHRDYSHFVKMKAALLVEQRQLEDKIRLGEEQLRGLRESLGLGLGIGMGMSMGYGHY
ncbi:protein Shroom4 [Brachionichthys hirsutus]|uniref:protein Shroom4 n=1 Tax=Brachionichthys hirsutus TaxID=412623 RepID=UPI00360461CB